MNTTQSKERRIALCYIRQSQTRDANDVSSPERQRANILALCQSRGWEAEFYEDAEGHKSGRDEKNRPAWLKLKARLGAPDVVALVANDLSRLHRKGWRVGDLLDFVTKNGVELALAAPGKQIDISTSMGRIIAQLSAIFDEWYADDISTRAKDSVNHRRKLGKTIARPPFGTIREASGYLKPSVEGAWYLPDGTFITGVSSDCPQDGAIWRGYFECVCRVFALYAEGNSGYVALSYTMQAECWAFQQRDGQPRVFDADDIRRIVLNWVHYGGAVLPRRVKNRGYYNVDPEQIQLNPNRSVLPIDLLKQVGRVVKARSVRPVNKGVRVDTEPYAFAGILYCAHCDALAASTGNIKQRTRLGGFRSHSKRRYRHREGRTCAATNRSVLTEIVEADFVRLLELLDVQEHALTLMIEFATAEDATSQTPKVDIERQKRDGIAVCKRRIDAVVTLYGDGKISKEEYKRRVEMNETEIEHWLSRTTDSQQIAIELALVVQTLNKLATSWKTASAQNRQSLVRVLFEVMVYDLDTHRIVDFKLKPWAAQFLALRVATYGLEDKTAEENSSAVSFQEVYPDVTPTGLHHIQQYQVNASVQRNGFCSTGFGGTRSAGIPSRVTPRVTQPFWLGIATVSLYQPLPVSFGYHHSGSTRL